VLRGTNKQEIRCNKKYEEAKLMIQQKVIRDTSKDAIKCNKKQKVRNKKHLEKHKLRCNRIKQIIRNNKN